MSITTKVVSASPAHSEVYLIQHYVIKFVSDSRQLGFLTNKTDRHDINERLLKVALFLYFLISSGFHIVDISLNSVLAVRILPNVIFNPGPKDHIALWPQGHLVWDSDCRATTGILVDLIWFFNATFSNISAISWRPVLVVEEAGVPGENHRPWSSNW